MVTRVLPEPEWPRLTETGWMLAQVQKASTVGQVLTVEDGSRILGCGMVALCAHLEGVWLHPDVRGDVAVGRRLWRELCASVGRFGADGVFCSSVTESSAALIEDRATELDGRHFVMELAHAARG